MTCQTPTVVADPAPVSSLSFPTLCTAMEAAGVEVHVELANGAHTIRLVDFHGCRSLAFGVSNGFDVAAIVICCSLGICPEGPVARQWPELVALARASVDVGVSDRGRPERLS